MTSMRTPAAAWRRGRPFRPAPTGRRSSPLALAPAALLLLAALIGAAIAADASAHHRPGHGGTGGGGGVPGTWQSTGDMITARRTVSGALLADGRVLVAGGFVSATTNTTRSELYDPTTGKVDGHGEPARGAPRTLTRLGDGRVLAAGGTTGDYIQAVLRSAELYDPTKGTWQATGWMTHGRSGHGAALLTNGRVLVESIGTAELFDPQTGTWSATGPMVSRRGAADTVTLLQDGRVLVAGGGPLFGSNPSPTSAAAELYDPATNTWSATGSLRTARSATRPPCSLTAGCSSSAAGMRMGPNWPAPRSTTPGTGSWTQLASMNVPRTGHKATRLADGPGWSQPVTPTPPAPRSSIPPQAPGRPL